MIHFAMILFETIQLLHHAFEPGPEKKKSN